MGKNKKKKKPSAEAAPKETASQQPPSLTEDDFPQLGDLASALPSQVAQPPARQATPQQQEQGERFSESHGVESVATGKGRGQDRGKGRGGGQDRGRGERRGQDVGMLPESPGAVYIESPDKDPTSMGRGRGQDRGRGKGRGESRGRGGKDFAMPPESLTGSSQFQFGTASPFQGFPEKTESESPKKDPTPMGRGRGQDRGKGRGQGKARGRGPDSPAGPVQFGSEVPLQQPAGTPTGPWKKPQTPTTPSGPSSPMHAPQTPITPSGPSSPMQKPQSSTTPAGPSPVPSQQMQQSQAQKSTPRPKQPPPSSTVVKRPMESSARIKPPRRPDEGGREGRPIKLLSNHIEVKFKPNLMVYHYDVEFVNFAKAPKKLKRRVFDTVINSPTYKKVFKIPPVFDGQKNMYSACLIPEIGESKAAKEFKIEFKEDDGKAREFILKIKYAEVYYSKELYEFVQKKSNGQIPREVIQVFDVVMRHQPLLKYIQAGRNFYIDEYFLNQRGNLQELGGGVCAWFGAFTSLRPGEWKITLNVDMSTTAFVKELTVIDYMKEVLEFRDPRIPPDFELNDYQRKTFAKQLKGLKIQALHQGQMKRKYPVLDVVRKNPSQHKFDCDGKEITTEAYFQKQYNYRLIYRKLQMLHVGQRTKQTMLPMEVCKIIPGQKYPHKINEKQTAAMIKYAACRPEQRFDNIDKIIKKLDFQNNKDLKNFGLNVSSNLLPVEGRILNVPDLEVKDRGQQKTPLKPSRDGVWDMRNNTLYDAASLKNWGVLNFCHRFDCRTFVRELIRQARNMGMTMTDPHFINDVGDRQHPEVHFKQLKEKADAQKKSLQLVICTIPTRTNVCTYENIKRAADIKSGIPSQCIKERNAQGRDGRPAPALLSNLLLKINAKIGGINNILLNPTAKLPILGRPVLILGADVTHPAPSEKHRPSIAALVGSMNPTLSRYVSDVKVQGHRVEPITDLAHMTRNMLLNFYHENKRAKPERIIMYRDGVSEGQFDYVLVHELHAIQKACTSLDVNYKPRITFIVVQKRHHTRLIPQNSRDGTTSGNVPPGTVVDRGITHPTEFDWFLCSHLGLQGTSKPAHYHVLYDDCEFKSDPLQNLTNHLTYMCFRCTRSISIPAPTYYAHLVAFRARSHLTGLESDHGSTAGTGDSGEVEINLKNLQAAVTLNNDVSKTMYFN